ncbi:hypothetical protein MIZ03_0006 [Rhodoferax lithotrophicus]|uniref:Uncharacterized protein n=1 Tax=Rhodoferax lithotrophicus TaxID=2798804 RepID=A0ABN6D2S6_9BURK|nr:hypothetical protein MIZ03_0006 [Rhodoferax sp. MIZ03]
MNDQTKCRLCIHQSWPGLALPHGAKPAVFALIVAVGSGILDRSIII